MKHELADFASRSLSSQRPQLPEKSSKRIQRGSTCGLRIVFLLVIVLLVIVAGNLFIQAAATIQSSRDIGKTMFTYSGQSAGGVYSLAWSPDGSRLISGSSDVRIWDALTGSNALLLHTKSAKGTYIHALAWSPDGTSVVTGSTDVVIWNAKSGQQVLAYTPDAQKSGPGGKLVINALDWSPDKTMIATAYSYTHGKKTYQWVDIWNAATGAHVFTYKGHQAAVKTLVWSSDSTRIASAGDDSTLQAWDAINGKNVKKYAVADKVNSIDWSPDGKYLVSASDSVQIWDVSSTDKPTGILDKRANPETQVAWSPDGKYIATSTAVIHIWNALSGVEQLSYTEHTGTIQALAWSPDSKYIASADSMTKSPVDKTDSTTKSVTDNAGVVRVWHAL